ncbi:MAG: PEP-CTERM sorting domain-containing protein [bacterium]
MRSRLITALITAVALASPAQAQVLWSNGSTPTFLSEANQFYTGPLAFDVKAYDNFTLSQTSTITGLFGYYTTFISTWTRGHYEIRSGMGVGSFGTLIASGQGDFAQVFVSPGDPEIPTSDVYFSQLLGLNIVLPAGDYWMFLAPETSIPAVISWSSMVGADVTDAVNAVGDLNHLVSNNGAGPFLGIGFPYDLAYGAYGVRGSVVAAPEPASMVLFATGLGMFGLVARRKRS